jgi:hypothetical protein
MSCSRCLDGGPRGLDEAGYALIAQQTPRLLDGRPRQLRRSSEVDWPTLIAVMQGATENGDEPFTAALELNRRLYSAHEIPLGVEHSRVTGAMPCGLWVDAERARLARRGVVEIRNSLGEWQLRPPEQTLAPLGECRQLVNGRWVPALALPQALEGLGTGNLCKLTSADGKQYAASFRSVPGVVTGTLALSPSLKKILRRPRVDFRHAPGGSARTPAGAHRRTARGGAPSRRATPRADKLRRACGARLD